MKAKSCLLFSAIMLFACEDKNSTPIGRGDDPHGQVLKKSGKSMDFKAKVTIEYENMAKAYSIDLESFEKSKSKVLDYDPDQPRISIYDVTMYESGGKQQVRIKPDNSMKKGTPLSPAIIIDGDDVYIEQVDGSTIQKTFFDKSAMKEKNKKILARTRNPEKVKRSKGFFQDILVNNKTDILSKAANMFDKTEDLGNGIVRLVTNLTDGEQHIVYNTNSSLVLEEKLYKNNELVSSTQYEYSNYNGTMFRSKTIREHLLLTKTASEPLKVKTTTEISDVRFN